MKNAALWLLFFLGISFVVVLVAAKWIFWYMIFFG